METDIILKWTLAEDTESRLEKFADWEQTRLKKMRKAWEAWNPTHDVPDMIDVDSSGKLGVSWSGISLKQMAESVGLGSSYDIEYSYLCEYAHGTATTFGDYVNVAEILGPDALPVDRTQKSLFYANKYWHSILETAGKHFGVQDDGRLGAIAVYIRDALAAEQFLDAIWEGIEKCTCHTYRLFYVDYNCFRLEAESKDTHEVLSSPEMEFVFPSEPGVTDANDFRDYAHELLASIHAAPE